MINDFHGFHEQSFQHCLGSLAGIILCFSHIFASLCDVGLQRRLSFGQFFPKPKLLLGLSCVRFKLNIGFSIVSVEKNDCLWTLKRGQKGVPKTSTLSKVLPSARTCGCQDNEPARKHSVHYVFFSAVTLPKIIGNVDPKMGCKIWTPFSGPPNCFFLSRTPKRGPDFRPHFGVHIARFFAT